MLVRKRIFLIVLIWFAVFAAIDRASLFFPPCGLHQGQENSENGGPDKYYCANREGLVWAGFEAISEWGPEVWTALATVAVAGFTLTLCLTSREQGILTNRAIEISRQGLTIAQWPFYYIDEQRFFTPISRPTPAACVQFSYKATIHGASPAMVRAIYGELIFDTTVPPIPPIKRTWRVAHGLHKFGFGLDQTIAWDGGDIITTPQDRAKARAAGKWLFAIGCIVYDDLFGNQHEFAFCYRGALGGGWGIRAGGEAYNYHRLRSDSERAQTDALAIPPPIEPPEPPEPLIAGKDIPM